MDIEQVKKVNELARELLNHGMASSLDEAVDKAKEMLNKDVVSAPKPAAVQMTIEKKPDITWQQAMAKNNEYIVKLLKEFQQKLDMMHSKIEELAKRPVQQIQPQPVQRKIEVPNSNNNNSSAEKKEPHARSGSFSPGSDDVAVDKIFYFGNK